MPPPGIAGRRQIGYTVAKAAALRHTERNTQKPAEQGGVAEARKTGNRTSWAGRESGKAQAKEFQITSVVFIGIVLQQQICNLLAILIDY